MSPAAAKGVHMRVLRWFVAAAAAAGDYRVGVEVADRARLLRGAARMETANGLAADAARTPAATRSMPRVEHVRRGTGLPVCHNDEAPPGSVAAAWRAGAPLSVVSRLMARGGRRCIVRPAAAQSSMGLCAPLAFSHHRRDARAILESRYGR